MIVEFRGRNTAAFMVDGQMQRGVSLRALGCPEHIVKKVIEARKRGASARAAAPASAPRIEAPAPVDVGDLRDRLDSVSL